MTYEEMLQAITQLDLVERRDAGDDYFEVVVSRSILSALTGILDDHFGSTFKAADEKPSKEASDAAAPYGGIFAGQTMYMKSHVTGRELAMLWPWGDGNSITVKVARERS